LNFDGFNFALEYAIKKVYETHVGLKFNEVPLNFDGFNFALEYAINKV
jgi:hypothetical protein